MKSYEEILEEYLSEDGRVKGIIDDLTNPMAINVHKVNNKDIVLPDENIAGLFVANREVYIVINEDKLEIINEQRFILAYLVAEFIRRGKDKEAYLSYFSISSIDYDIYNLAQKIYVKDAKGKMGHYVKEKRKEEQ